MAMTTKRRQPESPVSSSSLSIRPDDPITVLGALEQPDARVRSMLGAGLVTHLVIIGLVLLLLAILPKRAYQAILPDRLSDKIVWLSDPGPGGGGGGGNKMPDPPKKAEVKADVEPEIERVGETNVIVMEVPGVGGQELLDLSDRFKQRSAPAAIVLGSREDGTANLVVNFDQAVADKLSAGDRLGMIRFGSRTDCYMPRGTEVTVRVGERVTGGTTVIGVLR